MKITVEVKQSHIDIVHAGNCYDCPVARAINEAVCPDAPLGVVAKVSSVIHKKDGEERLVLATKFVKDGRTYFAYLPSSAQLFVNRFDNYVRCEPITFEIDAVNVL